MVIRKQDTNTETDVYYKPTDSKQYFLFTCSHPECKNTNNPFSLATDICKISNYEKQNKILQELKKIPSKRKYPVSLVDDKIE